MCCLIGTVYCVLEAAGKLVHGRVVRGVLRRVAVGEVVINLQIRIVLEMFIVVHVEAPRLDGTAQRRIGVAGLRGPNLQRDNWQTLPSIATKHFQLLDQAINHCTFTAQTGARLTKLAWQLVQLCDCAVGGD